MWPFTQSVSVTNSVGKKYFLHYKVVKLRHCAQLSTIYYFSSKKQEGLMRSMPEGFEVFESRTGRLPMLRRV